MSDELFEGPSFDKYDKDGREGNSLSGEKNNSGHPQRPRIQSARFSRIDNGYRPRYGEGGGYNGGYSGGYNKPNNGYQRPNNRYGQGGYNHYGQGGYNRPAPNQYNDYGQPANYAGGYASEGAESYGAERPYNKRPYGFQQQQGYGNRRPAYGNRPFNPNQGNQNERFFQPGGGRPYGNRPYGNRPYGNHKGGFNAQAKYTNKKRLEYKEQNIDPNQPIRLNKFLANAGVCSRRDADKFIASGVVKVNGEVVTELGTKVLRSDAVLFHDQPVRMEKKVYVLLNKPKGYVTTSDDPQNRKTVMDLVKNVCPERIYPVGRLDRNTTGVLLFTNDGELASKLTHPKFLKKKIYHVYVDHNVAVADMQQIANGIMLEDGEIKADAVEYANANDRKQIGIEIHSGKNRIVRRIFEHLGYHVVKLDRVYFAGLTKKNVKRGDWRFLTEKEVDMLRMGAFE
jgi:23S rRNA pseudouridine2605 synthase